MSSLSMETFGLTALEFCAVKEDKRLETPAKSLFQHRTLAQFYPIWDLEKSNKGRQVEVKKEERKASKYQRVVKRLKD